jgi:hypothetical protein
MKGTAWKQIVVRWAALPASLLAGLWAEGTQVSRFKCVARRPGLVDHGRTVPHAPASIRVFEREREENPRVSGERACCIEAMQQSGSTNPGASAMRHHREVAEQGLAENGGRALKTATLPRLREAGVGGEVL